MKEGIIKFDNDNRRVIIEAEDFYIRWASAPFNGVESIKRLDNGDYFLCFSNYEDFLDLPGIFKKYNINYDLMKLNLRLEE